MRLDLSDNKLDAAAAQQLVSGDWPELETLDLSENCLDNAAIKHLVQAEDWHLEDLHLQGNAIDAGGVSFLTEATWGLRHLTLDEMCVSAATWEVLGLDLISDLAEVQEMMANALQRKLVYVTRQPASEPSRQPVLWPSLTKVYFALHRNQR